MSRSLAYRPEIDGLRAIAILAVVLFHLQPSWAPGGFLGVDVFFVISGFLITSIVLREHEQGMFSLTGFWARRIRRLGPALFTVLIVTAAVGRFVLLPPEQRSLGEQGISVVTLTANIKMWRLTSGYWATTAADLPLLHCWSLSVEEQFYLFLPLLLAPIVRLGRGAIFGLLAVVVVASLALAIGWTSTAPASAFYLLPARAWELGAGCLLAAWRPRQSPRGPMTSAVGAWLGLIGIVAGFFIFKGGDSFAGWRPLLPVLGSVLVISCTENSGSLVQRILSSPAMVFVGKASYSLYLWHWPVIVFARHFERSGAGPASSLVLFAIISALAFASYLCIEPIGRWPRPYTPVGALLAGAVGAAVLLLSARNKHGDQLAAEWRGRLYDVGQPVPAAFQAAIAARMEGILVPAAVNPDPAAYAGVGIIKKHGAGPPTVVVLGDSHGLMWAGTVDEICGELRQTVAFYTADATSPCIDFAGTKQPTFTFTGEQKYAFDQARLQHLRAWKPRVVVVAVPWAQLRTDPGIVTLLEFLGSLRTRVVLLEQPPVLGFGDRNALHEVTRIIAAEGPRWDQTVSAAKSPEWESGRRFLREISQRFSFCRVVEVADIFRRGADKVWVLDGSELLYIDDDHLSQVGASKVKGRIKLQIEDGLSQPP